MKIKPYIITFCLAILLNSCIINNPKPEQCEVISIEVKNILEGPSYDIVFQAIDNETYYINRGLERGLTLDDLRLKLTGKTAKIHLPKVLGGAITAEHISQLEVDGVILYTEFD